jgi:hypothetical protein
MGGRGRIAHIIGSAALLGGALALSLAPAHAGNERCTTAVLDQDFTLPDGSVHGPGRLTICDHGAYSPVQALHVLYVNQRPVTMALSRRGVAEAASQTQPFMVFTRRPGGSLALRGYVVPERAASSTFLMRGWPGRQRQRDHDRGAAIASRRGPSDVLAAVIDGGEAPRAD